MFDDVDSPALKSEGKASKTDSSLERLLNDEEEVPVPMPIAFMAAPEAQAESDCQTVSLKEVPNRETSSAPKAYPGQLRTRGELRSPQL